MNKSFQQFVEDMDAKFNGIKDTIINFLKNELKITDDDVLMSMSTNDISDEVISKLMARGLVSSSNSDIIERIKNGISISELIDLLAGHNTSQPSNL